MARKRRDGSDETSESRRYGFSRRSLLKGAAVVGVAGSSIDVLSGFAAAAPNAITVENSNPGEDQDDWMSNQSDSIEGFTTEYSYAPGDTVRFKIRTPSTNYRIRIYRIGWYGGKGARRMTTINPSVPLPQAQPDPQVDPTTLMADAGNWAVSATWVVPTTAVSGVYYAMFERLDNNESNHTVFVVRRSGPSDVLLQTSEMTWHAYNRWGGRSLYWGADSRAMAVSYNRPFSLDGVEKESQFFAFEYPVVRWLERNGYDVAYCGDIDTHRTPSLLLNRKVYVSQGHDEYWSGPMRTNVAAARAAGVNLIFMTGNEVFWKVRMGPSIVAGGGDDRSIICYKETLEGAKTDPSPEWTGTWRDPRFSPPSNGGLPENELTGQLFRCILPTGQPDDTIQVPAEYAPLRFWRNTSIAGLTSGQVAQLGANTLGYEYDVDADNGFRPAGLIHLSSTTLMCPEVLQDYGGRYIPAVVTHNMSLYRHASGALVWGTGTTQWAYGLDDQHDTDPGTPVNRDMQQATVNVLADMGVQPATRQADLAAAAKSTDVVPPVSTITSPAEGANVPVGTPLVVSGVAVDSGGGNVATVEVSVDGGTTWHRATGRTSWTFTFTPVSPLGPLTIRTRATDDSCNIEAPSAGRTVQVVQRAMPCSIWNDLSTPATPSVSEASPIELGVKFRAAIDGFITGIRFYKGPGNAGTHIGNLWTAAGLKLSTGTFTNETASGWQTVAIDPVAITAGTTYVASVFMPQGGYANDPAYFNQAYDVWPLRALAHNEDGANGLYRYGPSSFPRDSVGASNYWIDVVFSNDDSRAPTVVECSPQRAIQSVALGAAVSATFSEAMNGSSIVIELRAAGGAPLAGTVSYDSAKRTASFQPSAPLAPLTAYTATVSAAKDTAGNSIGAPFVWSFTTVGGPSGPVLSLWDTSAVPERPAVSDNTALELGVKVRVDVPGHITGLRFYKSPGSSGTLVGNLWDAAGNLLGSVTFDGQTSQGWQQANLANPVAVQPGATYVASYHVPGGVFAVTPGGLWSGVDNGPLHSPPATTPGGNGVYRMGASGFPDRTASGNNYWADVVFAVAPDTTGPSVVNVVPAPNLIAVGRTAPVQVTFSEPINPASVQIQIAGPSGPVTGSVTYDDATRTAAFVASGPLAAGAEHTATVSAADSAGNAMVAPYSWTFRTVNPVGVSPMTLWDTSATPATVAALDGAAVELGVRVRPDRNGVLYGIRYYKAAANGGPHVGHVWSATGTLLASAAFDAETVSGWQQAMFASPLPVVAGSDYIVSYHAPKGSYSVTPGYFNAGSVGTSGIRALAANTGNGLYLYGPGGFPTNSYNGNNYWIDVIYGDVAGPSVVQQSPLPGAANVDPNITVTATFDEDVVPASIGMQVRDAGGAQVAGTVSYDATSRTARFTPSAPLGLGATYTASVVTASDPAGNAMGAPASWSFATVSASLFSIWPTGTPAVPDVGNDGPVELGVRFQTSQPGKVHGVRFYKSSANAGPHVGRLWGPDGSLLASVTFTGESASGWQYAAFDAPIDVVAGATYVASYHVPSGHWSSTAGGLAADVVNGPLKALGSGGNGVYRYGPGGVFPSSASGNSSNYWVDVAFEPSAGQSARGVAEQVTSDSGSGQTTGDSSAIGVAYVDGTPAVVRETAP